MTAIDEARALVAKHWSEWNSFEDGMRAKELLAKALELADLNDQRAKEWERLAQEALQQVKGVCANESASPPIEPCAQGYVHDCQCPKCRAKEPRL